MKYKSLTNVHKVVKLVEFYIENLNLLVIILVLAYYYCKISFNYVQRYYSTH